MASLPHAARVQSPAEFVTHWPAVGAALGLTGLIILGLSTPFWMPASESAMQEAAQLENMTPRPVPESLRPRFEPQSIADTLLLADVSPIPKSAAAQAVASHEAHEPRTPEFVPEPMNRSLYPAAEKSSYAANRLERDAESAKVYELLLDLRRHAVVLDLRTEKGAESAPRKNAERKDAEEPILAALLKKPEGPASTHRKLLVDQLALRSDLAGLPLVGEQDCDYGPEKIGFVKGVSTWVRAFDARRGPRPSTTDEASFSFFLQQEQERQQDLATAIDKATKMSIWNDDQAVSTLVQMLQLESEAVRWKLVERLRHIKGSAASVALAERALFDVSADIRRLAHQALRTRPASEYQPRLVEGLRYPWAPVAQHAAEALAEIGDTSAIGPMAPLADKPDPALPWLREDKKWVVKELVAVNHMRNCLLCHAPSHSEKDEVRGLVPTPGQPLPALYYAARGGSFVRADTVYIKQDFSALQHVEDHGNWPAEQRFDYFVRERELTPAEVAKLPAATGPRAASYPQREAVLLALRQLEGLPVKGKVSSD